MPLAGSASTPSQAARRFYVRRKLEGLSYVEFGPDNGAILIDIGEGGIGFQSVLPVTLSDTLLFKFKFPGESNFVEGFGEVVWMNDSGKGGGLRFTEVADADRAKIREWAGEPGAPATGNSQTGNNAGAPTAKIKNTAGESVNPESTATKATDQFELAAKASEEFSTGENAQPPSPSMNAETDAVEVVEAVAADPAVAADIKNSEPPSIPEFTIEAMPAETPTVRADSIASAATAAAKTLEQNPEVAQPATRPRVKNHTADAPFSVQASGAGAEVAAADARISTRNQTRHIPGPAAANPDTKLIDSAPTTGDREAPFIPTVRPGRNTNAWQGMSGTAAEELQGSATLAAQALRIGIGVAAGAAVALLLFLIIPSLRTRVEATAARPAAFNTIGAPAFEVEVADIDNRRWVLRSGGEAGSPFGTSSKREAESSSSAKSDRSESGKASRAEEAADSTTTSAKPKSAKPGELVLSRPRVAQRPTASAQTLAPSIFDGITPPIGSLSDRLATGGPEAPGIVQTETPQPRTVALQSAVLVQRVSPVYPPAAMESRVQGDVQVNATISKDGVPKDLKVISGDLRLVPAALTAIRQWRYRPATLSGSPIDTQMVITVSFQLK